ncbi:MAG: hydroxyacid dehydrogenase [Clostridia bacterium]|nr:hydroxyacid dehydrogenase [Clostridia bacterium]
MKITVLDAATLGADLDLSFLSELGEVTVYQSTAPDKVSENLGDCEVTVINKVKLGAYNLSTNTSLKLICIAATGYDNVDVEYCRSKGIGVCNVIGYSSDSVAQFTLASALSLATNLTPFCDHVFSGEYTRSGIHNCLTPVFHEVAGMTWGIVGLGNIGKAVARVASALGCRVIAHKRSPDPDYECVSMDDLCRRSDIISLHTPLNDGTRGIISRERIQLMKKNVILINAARGAVVDEDAVTDAVINEDIAGFASDVYSVEPLQPTSPFNRLLGKKNVILTPHMAWGSYESRVRCLKEICKNINAFFSGEPRNLL